MTSLPEPPAPTLDAPRPESRRAEIALVAAEEFTRRGYHATRVEHIADRLDVTPGALYRYVPGKYEMFRDAVATLMGELEAATAGAGDLDQLVASVTRTTLTHRSRAALYRWQARYLAPADRAVIVAADSRVRQRVAAAVRDRRGSERARPLGPDGGAPGGAGAMSAAGAILACIASLGHHRIVVTDPEAVVRLMTSIATDLAASIPGPRSGPGANPTPATPPADEPRQRLRGGAATREGAITAAIARFHSSGYDDVTMEAIGADVGVAASALYRHFPGKSALLTAAVDRTGALVGDLLDRHAALHSSGADPAEVLAGLLGQYVDIAFSHGPELMLYHSELGTLNPDDRRRIRRAQRRQLDRWAGLVLSAAGSGAGHGTGRGEGRDPDQDRDHATALIRVHAALAVVIDGGQATGFHPAAAVRFGELARIALLPR
ncbi:TetR/AcrR family transcriptional regulator [Rhodococcus sp. IEGM 1408]|uniref:TetR/AcrR family transcriptional regulator n=1 Tax=Rhodococcus sp. IEGM 1408 TaxID=3082220 RepID=UPI00295455AF|nr:TetR/AcrR family transcriptional regulator [Rhodococcus sp. IEGM 1408]MDV8000027.1 TetR/AcrR family transcriptional regulator [Rhodococcus sp. IEGM 1408]